jgi:hypothetical protein
MAYTVEVTQSVVDEMSQMADGERQELLARLQALKVDPFPGGRTGITRVEHTGIDVEPLLFLRTRRHAVYYTVKGGRVVVLVVTPRSRLMPAA